MRGILTNLWQLLSKLIFSIFIYAVKPQKIYNIGGEFREILLKRLRDFKVTFFHYVDMGGRLPLFIQNLISLKVDLLHLF